MRQVWWYLVVAFVLSVTFEIMVYLFLDGTAAGIVATVGGIAIGVACGIAMGKEALARDRMRVIDDYLAEQRDE